MKQVPLGAKGIVTFTVGPEDLASKGDPMLAKVLSTPKMIWEMEMASFEALKPYLEAGETTVGTGVDIQHLAATPPGHQVRVEAEVVKVEGRRIELAVSAFDEVEQIGSGTHRRAVVSAAKFDERIKAKTKS